MLYGSSYLNTYKGLIKYYQGEGVGEMEGGVAEFCFVVKGGHSVLSCSKRGVTQFFNHLVNFDDHYYLLFMIMYCTIEQNYDE